MIVDCHTHIMWYPDHLDERFAQEALAAKLVKLKHSGGEAYAASLDLHCSDSKPEEHWKASAPADRVIVFGLQAKATGIWVPNELIADYVGQHPEKLEGWASVDPNEPDCVEQLEYCVEELGLKGLKLGPVYQHFDPQDRKHWPLFKRCQELELPIMWHQGTTFPSRARLKWSRPLQLEDIAMDFPDLKMIIAHLGHPWEEDVDAIEAALATHEYAGLILEPGGGSNNRLPFHPGVLSSIRQLTEEHGVLLIFDEIITGFRYAPGGAQQRYGIIPDLTALGKTVGGGLPSAALCGRREIMQVIQFRGDAHWDRFGRVMHTGTFNSHPLAAVAGATVLEELQRGERHAYLDALGERLRGGINEVIRAHGIQGCCHGESSIYHVFLNNHCPHNESCDKTNCDNDFETLARGMGPLKGMLRLALLLEGIDEVGDGGGISTAHTEEDIDRTIMAYDRAIDRLEEHRLL